MRMISRAASQAKLALLEAYPPEHAVRIVRGAGTSEAAVTDTTLAALGGLYSLPLPWPLFVALAVTHGVAWPALLTAASAEAARVVPAELSPNGKALLLVSNEASGSFRVFEIAQAK